MFPKVSGTRLEILKMLAKGPMSPSEISRSLGRSLSTVTRHLAYLEGSGFIRRVGEEKGRTRPYVKYALEETVILIKIMKDDIGALRLPLSEELRMRLRVWSIPQPVFHYYIEGFLWRVQDFISSIAAIAVYGPVAEGNAPSNSDVKMLILTRDDTAELRKRFRAVTVKRLNGDSKRIIAQIFTLKEFKRALPSNTELLKALRSALPIYDPDKTLEKLKTEHQGGVHEGEKGEQIREKGLKRLLCTLIGFVTRRLSRLSKAWTSTLLMNL